MLDTIHKLIPEILESDSNWDSLIINRRKPFTYRIFRQFGDSRVCLHKFDTCSEQEAFPHPHPWPGEFLVLHGQYINKVGISEDLISKPKIWCETLLTRFSGYEIKDPHIWHSVIPLKPTYTLMVNGAPFENPHKEVRTTKGKDLDKISQNELLDQLLLYKDLLENYLFYKIEGI